MKKDVVIIPQNQGDAKETDQNKEGMVVRLGSTVMTSREIASKAISTMTTDVGANPRATAHGTAPGSVESGGMAGLGALITIMPNEINAIGEDGWEEVELAVDSGASETVVSEDMIASAELKEGPAARGGIQYEVANGVRIPNLGEKRFVATSGEGVKRQIVAQVCEVNKGLLSVRRMVQAGNTVVFTRNGGYIEDDGTGGGRMHMEEKNGMYMLKLWTRSEKTSGF